MATKRMITIEDTGGGEFSLKKIENLSVFCLLFVRLCSICKQIPFITIDQYDHMKQRFSLYEKRCFLTTFLYEG